MAIWQHKLVIGPSLSNWKHSVFCFGSFSFVMMVVEKWKPLDDFDKLQLLIS